MELEGTCRTAGCKEQHRHPITGVPPDYHWVRNGGEKCPRWRGSAYRKPGADSREWFYRTAEVATACGVTQSTVRTWFKKGLLKNSGQDGGYYLVKGCDLEAFLRARRTPYPAPAHLLQRKG